VKLSVKQKPGSVTKVLIFYHSARSDQVATAVPPRIATHLPDSPGSADRSTPPVRHSQKAVRPRSTFGSVEAGVARTIGPAHRPRRRRDRWEICLAQSVSEIEPTGHRPHSTTAEAVPTRCSKAIACLFNGVWAPPSRPVWSPRKYRLSAGHDAAFFPPWPPGRVGLDRTRGQSCRPLQSSERGWGPHRPRCGVSAAKVGRSFTGRTRKVDGRSSSGAR
jgi:hypothetical protein